MKQEECETLKEVKCPKCPNKKVWLIKSLVSRQYGYKCDKCGHTLK